VAGERLGLLRCIRRLGSVRGPALPLISSYAVNIFYSDEWEFNDAALFQKHSLWQMFAWQHGLHRCYLRTESLKGCNQLVGVPIFSHPPEHTHLQEKLQFLKRTHLNLYLKEK